LLGGVNALHTSFPDDPEEEYKTQGNLLSKYYLKFSFLHAFSALTLLVGWQEGHLACKN